MPATGRRPQVLCVGATIVDVLGRPVTQLPEGQQGRQLLEEIRITAAGTAAGTAVDLAKLGADVTLIGAVGHDALADYLVMTLHSYGISTSGLARKKGVQTSATILPIRPNGDRPALHCPGASARLDGADVDLALVDGFDALHLGGPDVLGEFSKGPAREVLGHARQKGIVTSLDVLSPCSPVTWGSLRPLMPYVDYFLPNDQQLRNLTGIDDLVDAARRALGEGVGTVLVSCGAAGCLLVTHDGATGFPALAPDLVVDTTGCGDACSAGFLVGVLHGWPASEAAWLAMAAGGAVAGGLGSDAGIRDLFSTAQRAIDGAPREVADRLADHLRRLSREPSGGDGGDPSSDAGPPDPDHA